MSKERHLTSFIRKAAESPIGRIIILTGARQVGKTTTVQNDFADYGYISVEDPIQRAGLKSIGTDQWHSTFPIAALDEVQKEPALIESIKAVYDKYKDSKYILLGSSQILLLQKVKETLAGRCVIFDMFPLCIPELQTPNRPLHYSAWQHLLTNQAVSFTFNFSFEKDYASALQAYAYYLSFGGYPALVGEGMNDDMRYQWLQNYTRTYLERDLRDLAAIKDLEPFIKLQQALALQTGTILNVSNLSRDLGISSPTISRYLQYLSLSYQIISLPAWERNYTKRLVHAPKLHFVDQGVLQAILNRRGGLSGNEYESAIVSEIYKQAKSIAADVRFYHLRTHEGREIDLLADTPQGYYAFEIKMTEHVSPTDARHLLHLSEILTDKPIIHSYILSNDLQTHEFTPDITAVHAAYFLG